MSISRSIPKNISWLFVGVIALVIVQSCSTSKEAATDKEPEPPGAIEQKSVLTNIDSMSADTSQLPPPSPEESETEPKEEPKAVNVDSLLAEMSLKEKIGQLFFIRAYGYYKSDGDAAYQQLLNQVKNFNVGGLVFFNGDIYGQAVLTNKLQRASNLPLWITQDMEYGAAMRISGTTRFVPAMGVAATQNPDYAYWVGKVTGREAKALGVNQIFAPVLDVNNNPQNPVINVRSFSS